MLKGILIVAAAALVFCGIGSASAKTVRYTFDGSCDGLTLSEVSGVATGTHTGKKCTGGEGDYAGGFSGKKVLGATDTDWVITTQDTGGATGMIEVFIIDQTAMTYTLYEETANTGEFAYYGAGSIVDGAPRETGDGPTKSVGTSAKK